MMFNRFLLMYMAIVIYLPLAVNGQQEIVGAIGFYLFSAIALYPEQ